MGAACCATAEGCDLVVVLAHTGFEIDPETGEPNGTAHENFTSRLTEVPGIDLLLTGHSHEDIPPHLVNGVIVSQPRARAQLLTRIDLEMVRGASGWKVSSWEGSNLATGKAAADPEIVRANTLSHQRLSETLDGPVGAVTGEVRVENCRREDCAAVDLLHAVQLEASGAQLSLAALLNAHAPPLSERPRELALDPRLLRLSQHSGGGAPHRRPGPRHPRTHRPLLRRSRVSAEDGCTVLTDAAIPHYNVDTMAGVSYRIDPTRPEGSRIRDLRFEGLPIDPEAIFTVACNSYRASGGGLLPAPGRGRGRVAVVEEMADLIGDYLMTHQPWHPVVDDNWHIGRDVTAEEHAQPATAR